MRWIFALTLIASASAADWNDPFPPHRVIGNLYYVGTAGLSNYLITTDQGHILINSSFDRSVPLIKASVEKLGFRFSDIKILLDSHAHDDHTGGHARVRELTGAKVYVMAGDDAVIRASGCPVDRVLHDGDEVKLGNVTLNSRLTPGHTPGCTTWTTRIDGKDVVIVGSPNVNPGYILVNNRKYPQISEDFARTFRVLKALSCDVFLGAHGSYYGLDEKYAKLGKSKDNPFIDPAGYQAYVTERQQAFERELARQRGKR